MAGKHRNPMQDPLVRAVLVFLTILCLVLWFTAVATDPTLAGPTLVDR